MLMGVSHFQRGPCPMCGRKPRPIEIASDDFLALQQKCVIRTGLGIKSGEPASSWESPTALRRKSWPS